MPDATPLSPAEALFLLRPNLTNGLRTIRVTLLSLLARGILRVEEQEETGLFRTKKVPHVRIASERTPTLPPHVTAVVDIVRAAQADGGKMRDLVKRAEKEFKTGCHLYNYNFLAPALVERGLIEVRKWWFSHTYHATPAGEQERQRIKTDIANARGLPKLLKSDPAQAVALALALGGTLLLADDLRKHYKQFADAMHSYGFDGGPIADIDSNSFDASQLGGSVDVGSFDLGSFDACAFNALDGCMASFDTGFSEGGGGDSYN